MRRSRLLPVLATVLVLGAASIAIVVLMKSPPAKGGGPTTTAPSTTAPSTTTTAPKQVTGIGTYSVATTSLTVDVPGLPPTDGRLPTAVWYPVPKPGTVEAHHRYPLLVFSEGYGQAVTRYSALLVDWASAGFVVAGPTYPHTSPSSPTTLDRSPSELGHHPADLRAVITTLLEAGRTSGSALSGKIDASEIGVVGHSDGGDVSLAVAANSCCRYAGVKAAAILSGAEYGYFGGQYFAPGTPAPPPLLVVQGNDDPTYNPPVCSAQLYDAAPPPKYYLDLFGATHLDPYEDATTWETVVAAVTTDFFDAELAGEPAALTKMAANGNVTNVAQLSTGPTAPPATGTCFTAPGAPTITATTAPTTTTSSASTTAPTSTTTTSTTTTSTTTTSPPSTGTSTGTGAAAG